MTTQKIYQRATQHRNCNREQRSTRSMRTIITIRAVAASSQQHTANSDSKTKYNTSQQGKTHDYTKNCINVQHSTKISTENNAAHAYTQ